MELIIASIVDMYRDNVASIEDPALRDYELRDCYYLADRALFWGQDDKVVVTSLPLPLEYVAYVQQALGYKRLVNLAPRQPSTSLFEDVLHDHELWAAIVAHLQGTGPVRLIASMAAPQVHEVAAALRAAGIAVTTPECPPAARLAVRDYLDGKAGFREFFAAIQDRVPGVRLPEGLVAAGPAEAARAAARFLGAGRGCLCKPNYSQSGVGIRMLRPGDMPGSERQIEGALRASLETDSQMTADVIVVEELIEMDPRLGGGSPSLEMRVPADPAQEVEFMYLCGQILSPTGYFHGVEMYRELLAPELERMLEEAGLEVAREVRRRGYVGIFDMDLVAGRDGAMYAVEINTRRTGGTHAHEAAEALFGPRYWQRCAVICNNALHLAGAPLTYGELQGLLEGIRFPAAAHKEGILPTIITSLAEKRFGYLAMAADIARARELEHDMWQRLTAAGRPPEAR
ncbi:MAG TPA: hypothetical protein PLG21_07510 [Anaerolineae bacterium]|nr:hypothetical protein [Anaerolineae bacterium]HPL27892.1 hypothetical protein [Anaerolineae bacterium]